MEHGREKKGNQKIISGSSTPNLQEFRKESREKLGQKIVKEIAQDNFLELKGYKFQYNKEEIVHTKTHSLNFECFVERQKAPKVLRINMAAELDDRN